VRQRTDELRQSHKDSRLPELRRIQQAQPLFVIQCFSQKHTMRHALSGFDLATDFSTDFSSPQRANPS
jgi:hypothetical protein